MRDEDSFFIFRPPPPQPAAILVMELADGKSNPDRQMVSNYFKKYSRFTFRKLRLRFRFRFEVQISDSSDSSDSDSDSDSGVLKIGTFFLIQNPLEIFQ